MPEEFSKPLAPNDDDFESSDYKSSEKQPLTNADFRLLLETPRICATNSHNVQPDSGHSFTHRAQSIRKGDDRKSGQRKPHTEGGNNKKAAKPKTEEDDDELLEIMKKYRDRAKERRQGEVQENQQEIDLIQASGYKAVAPDLKINLDLVEKRKKVIEESKYLGGDMEHTHLVKGLDYALLQKVKSEIVTKEREEEDLEKAYLAKMNEREEIESQLKNPLARNIYNTLFKNELVAVKLNELFATRRMAYVMEMDEEFTGDTEIPTTLIRSKQDCPVDDTNTNLSINDVVIQKLTQVLSYLRADNKKKKKAKDKMPDEDRSRLANQNIFDDAGEFVPAASKQPSAPKEDKPNSYFEKSTEEVGQSSKATPDETKLNSMAGNKSSSNKSLTAAKNDKNVIDLAKTENQVSSKQAKPSSKSEANDSYAECYPGGYECYDAAGDSDDDADFSKMDMGNKKGLIKRWDFETEQEYEEYMSMREALPKAAFQYGVKMLDGRKTRKVPGGVRNERDEKAKIDRQWAKISQILSKRKDDREESEPAKKIKF